MSWLINFSRLGLKTPSPDPDPDPELDHPWRPVAWSEDNKNEMLKYLKDFQPGTAEVSEIKILLHGPIGAGKSSFINSVSSVLQGYNTTGALADSTAGKSHSFNQEFKIHRLKKDRRGTFYPFTLSDIMGLEPGDSEGVQTEDIIKILKGHVKSGYTFNPVKSTEECDQKPSLKDRVHCLVSVLPADRISLTNDNVFQKMRAVQKNARDLGIPQVVIMSLVDKACPLVNKNLDKIYTSKKIKEKMVECSHTLGVPMNCIFPVRNYHEQTSRNNIFEASFTEARLMSWNRLINVFRLGRKTPSPNPEPDPDFDRSWRPVAWSRFILLQSRRQAGAYPS
ncbi:interferon-induced protein 44-like isoform X2 [Neoarius graeffei]|uniref:interferon-induced protein 44-like isoform X2 n=1 Tax=Neoarius graeffei TaxID=443677 RepID=UPI00298C2945|nr:interferon-induced protein 44-like isoform X2 [Neoarius graeffei]